MSELNVIDVDKMADVRSLSGQFYRKSEADKEIQRLEKLVETADKLVKQKGGFTVNDVEFGGVKLEGTKE